MIWREIDNTERAKHLAIKLQNYKATQAEKAKKEGKLLRLMTCKTVTEARKVMRGEIN